jgi:AraC-like DNA-binding protein
VSKVPSASTIRREWLFSIAQIFQVWAGTVAEESAVVLQRKLTALPPPVTRLEALVLRGMTAELWEHVEPAKPARVPAKQPRLVRDAQRYLETHYAEHVTITDMSRSLGCSRAQLTRAFRSCLAVSVHEYLTEIRARHAVHALHSSTEKVEAVALMVGYKSKKDLYRTIRATTGVTPKRVRLQASQQHHRIHLGGPPRRQPRGDRADREDDGQRREKCLNRRIKNAAGTAAKPHHGD